MEETVCAVGDRLVPVNPTRADDANRWFRFLHYARLHGRGVRAQHNLRIVLNEEGILHVSRGMIVCKVKGGKDMPVILYFRTFGNGETEPFENIVDLLPDNGDGVACSQRNR